MSKNNLVINGFGTWTPTRMKKGLLIKRLKKCPVSWRAGYYDVTIE
ncbi:MAG: hypothetical protein M3Z92_00030 [Bacteroidota bacterium]|nr:hypothetical protein [Bacteroidota bacterium]